MHGVDGTGSVRGRITIIGAGADDADKRQKQNKTNRQKQHKSNI